MGMVMLLFCKEVQRREMNFRRLDLHFVKKEGKLRPFFGMVVMSGFSLTRWMRFDGSAAGK
jgi:hypothetical protein